MSSEQQDSPIVWYEPPLVVQGVSTLSVVGAILALVGVFTNTRHLLQGIGAGEAAGELLRDVFAVLYGLLLTGVSVFSFLAMRQRRAIGRWVAVGIGSYFLLQTVPFLLYAMRASTGELSGLSGGIEFSSAQEAKGTVAMLVAGFLFFAAVTAHLALSPRVTAYFKSGTLK